MLSEGKGWCELPFLATTLEQVIEANGPPLTPFCSAKISVSWALLRAIGSQETLKGQRGVPSLLSPHALAVFCLGIT